MQPKIVGLCGVARSGKDTTFSIIKSILNEKNIQIERVALADPLKDICDPFLIQNFGVSIFDCSPKLKEMFRPFLVWFGKMKRIESFGTYWTSLASKKINSLIKQGKSVCVTDCRYCEYEKDEDYWLQYELNGSLIYISREDETGKIIKPVNEDELRFDPIMKKRSNYHIHQKYTSDINYKNNKKLRKKVLKVVEKIWNT